MFLVVGLGNPGKQYECTRHNVGFLFVDKIAEEAGVLIFQEKFHALVAKTKWKNFEILLVKPQTFMNLSGKSVSQILSYFKIPESRMIVVFDDLDLSFGVVKTRIGGGAGGHNGIIHILDQTSSDKFHRIKIGIGRPQYKSQTADWVLTPFQQSELELLEKEIFVTAKIRLEETLKQLGKS